MAALRLGSAGRRADRAACCWGAFFTITAREVDISVAGVLERSGSEGGRLAGEWDLRARQGGASGFCECTYCAYR